MKFSRSVDHALVALLELANHRSEAPLSASAIASRTGMPEHYLKQIMHLLKDAGLVTTARGVRGGCRLAKPIGRISLQEVGDAIEGRYEPAPLPTQALTAASQRLIDETLADVAANTRRRLSDFTLDSLKLSK